MDRRVCRGKILFIDDLITYESSSPSDLQKEFEAAVDDYIETCKLLNRSPQKPLKGQFNVRVAPEKHKSATLRAIQDGVSLNEVVNNALDLYLCGGAAVVNHEHNHNVRVTLEVDPGAVKTVTAGSA